MKKVTLEIYREYLIKRLELLKEPAEDLQKTSDCFEIVKQMDYVMKELYLLDKDTLSEELPKAEELHLNHGKA
ncbi:MAG: hypothetical protein E7496_12240 [Ruminococcus sp.]|nr:hypothetical protein [Ruminococcus sp.]